MSGEGIEPIDPKVEIDLAFKQQLDAMQHYRDAAAEVKADTHKLNADGQPTQEYIYKKQQVGFENKEAEQARGRSDALRIAHEALDTADKNLREVVDKHSGNPELDV